VIYTSCAWDEQASAKARSEGVEDIKASSLVEKDLVGRLVHVYARDGHRVSILLYVVLLV
jgi:hypothetical protein